MRAGLPSLHNLRLGADIGVQLRLGQKGRRYDPVVGDVDGFDARAPGDAAPGVPRLEKLIANLQTDSALIDQWRQAIRANMQSKRTDYTNQIDAVLVEVEQEQYLQLRMVEAARRPVELVRNRAAGARAAGLPPLLSRAGGYSNKDDEAPHNLDDRVENTSLANMRTDKYAIIDTDRFNLLNLRVEAINKLLVQINARENALVNDREWSKTVARFAQALGKLLDYPEQTAMIDKVVDIVRSFVVAPTIAAFQFNNVMITGPAGTGKTRLAKAFGSIFAQLGMYAYDDFVEANIGDFIASFEGQTETKVVNFLQKNAEKVVFLDEAYALTKWNTDHTYLEGANLSTAAPASTPSHAGRVRFLHALSTSVSLCEQVTLQKRSPSSSPSSPRTWARSPSSPPGTKTRCTTTSSRPMKASTAGCRSARRYATTNQRR